MDDHMHDRFLQEQDDYLIFGCVNPFCGHGSPALPNRWKIPKETDALKIKLLSHKDGKVKIEITVRKTSKRVVIECADNAEACAAQFELLRSGLE